MILTGKCKEDFLKTKIGSEVILFESMLPIYQHALIIEWFDSVGYYFNTGLSFIKSKPYKCELYTLDNDNILGECYEFKGKFLSIKQLEATKQAIIKANEIYNERYII